MAHLGGKLTDTDKAYIAGVIDGEGCFYLGRVKAKNGKTHYYANLTVEMGCEAVPRYLYEKCGGYLTSRIRKNRDYLMWCWRVEISTMEALVENILPFLVEKKHEANIILDFRREIKKRHGKLRFSLSDEELLKREQLIRELKKARKTYAQAI